MGKKYSDGRPETHLTIPAEEYGIVLRHGSAELDGYGIREPLVFECDGTYLMHYDASDEKTGWRNYLATSKDLIHWDKKGVILDLGAAGEDDSSCAVYGVTYLEDGVWHMFYIGSDYHREHPYDIPDFPYVTMKAKSDSPYGPWIKQDIIPFRMKENTYYSTTASSGAIVKDGDEYLQFFSASVLDSDNITKRTLGVARTKDLDGEWAIDPEPLFPLEEQIENSTVFYEEETETWFLFTNHVGINEIKEYTDAIWVYWTKDIQNWDVNNKALVFDGSMSTWSKSVIGAPSVFRQGNKLALYYDGVEGAGFDHFHRHIGLAWINLPIQLPDKQ
ncbi:hypothetical protein Back11_01800 [Paenibacillus baekrokdamisoli]|uniref:Uncharacterized protein n=1 Tax=Paenibacillus baekrokdamisoli TaxID=1712516 RepID=A0A3G9ISA4_9BACL|nr:hypothetical protein [Paenibacillus baekrokdamisoli]MBB3069191.1 putative GH43/DUF377 family glycosyl hydrolase [Paenibacillus baekrokdamisoli]BBH18835.1 hypothetical protein Back11_01800 [Paenibacillus baekrokdamisoli]